MKKTIFLFLLSLVFSGCRNEAGPGPGILDGVITKLMSRMSDATILKYSGFMTRYGSYLKTAAIALTALLILIWVVRFIRKSGVKRQESHTRRAFELVGLIEENSLEAIAEKDRKLIEKLLICRLCRLDPEQEIPANLEEILNDAKNDRLLAGVTLSVAKVKSKAGQAGIETHAGDLQTLDRMLHEVTEILGILKSNTYSFAGLSGIRFSTVNMFVTRIDRERERLLTLLDDLGKMSELINVSLDQIIASQDEAIVTQVFKGTAGQVADRVPAETRNEIDRLKGKMEEMIETMREGYAKEEPVEKKQ